MTKEEFSYKLAIMRNAFGLINSINEEIEERSKEALDVAHEMYLTANELVSQFDEWQGEH